METIIKSFVGIICLLFLTVTGIGITYSAITSRNANLFMEDCVDKIEASHYASGVISACCEDAKNNGYEMNVSVYNPKNSKYVSYGNLLLTYPYGIQILGIENKRTIGCDLW